MSSSMLRRLTACGAAIVLASAWARAESSDSFRIEDGNFGTLHGIAGVSFSENFEMFNLGPGCGQQGWTCGPAPSAFNIVNTGISSFGERTARLAANGTSNGAFDLIGPVVPLEVGIIQADIIITSNTSVFQFATANTLAGPGHFNTRLRFDNDGTIRAMQAFGQLPCTSIISAGTTGTWTAGVKMRIGIEVLPGNILRAYKDGVQIFQGHDIAQFCAASDPDVGINQFRAFNSNSGTIAQMYVDTVSRQASPACDAELPPCSADIQAPYGVVDVGDLLQIISYWGSAGPPRPTADCAPPPYGDCMVDVQDLLAVIRQWGECPQLIGACCISGQCNVVAQSVCDSLGGAFQGDGSSCGPGICSFISDHCEAALPIGLGLTPFSTISATTDGVPSAPGQCSDLGQNDTHHDIWFTYHATHDGGLRVTTCAQLGGYTDFNSDIVIYRNSLPGGADCAPADTARIACNDDDVDHPCGQGPPRASTAIAVVTAGEDYRIRVGGGGPRHQGNGALNLAFEQFVCGNGLLEIGEECDDGNVDCGDGCCDCICKYAEPADCEAEGEPCLDDGPNTLDTTNGGCNITPTVYGTISVNGPAKCGTGSTYVFAGGSTRRDTDWYRFVVTATANHHIEIRSGSLGWLCGIVSGVQAPGQACVGADFVAGSAILTTGTCNVAGGTVSLAPAAYAAFSAPGAFTGFPCSSGPHTYVLQLKSP